MKDSREIEEVFKDSFQNFEFEAPVGAWAEIEKGVQPLNAKIRRRKQYKYIGIAATSLLLIGSTYFLSIGDESTKSTELPVSKAKQEIVQNQQEQLVKEISNSETVQSLTKEVVETETSIDQMNQVVVKSDQQLVKPVETRSSDSKIVTEKSVDVQEEIPSNFEEEVIHQEEAIQEDLKQVSSEEIVSEKLIKDEPIQKELPKIFEINAAAMENIVDKQISFQLKGISEEEIASIEWDFGNGSYSDEKRSSMTYSEEGNYIVSATGKLTDGTEFTRDFELDIEASPKVVIKGEHTFAPNTFTPNNDGTNELYKVICSDQVVDFHMIVLDYKNGNKVLFESTDQNEGWDGTDRYGNPVKVGSYLLKVNAKLKDDENSHYNKIINVKR